MAPTVELVSTGGPEAVQARQVILEVLPEFPDLDFRERQVPADSPDAPRLGVAIGVPVVVLDGGIVSRGIPTHDELRAALRQYRRRERPGLRWFLQGRWLGRPLHPSLIPVPIGFWTAAAALDVMALLRGLGHSKAATAVVAGGLIGAAAAASAGAADYTRVPQGTRARRMATVHALLNAAAVATQLGNLALRLGRRGASPLPTVCSLLTVTGVAVSGHLGQEMVYKLGVNVPAARQARE